MIELFVNRNLEKLFHTPILVINLETEKSRFLRCVDRLSRLGFKTIVRIKAVLPGEARRHQLNFFTSRVYKNIQNFTSVNSNIIPTWAAAACAISHLKAWHYASSRPEEVFLIVEDDVLIRDEECALIHIYEAFLRCNGLNLFFFNSKEKYIFNNSYYYGVYRDKNFHEGTFYEIPGYTQSLLYSHFYMVSKQCLQLMTQHAYPIEYQIDIHITKVLKLRCQLRVWNTTLDCSIYQEDHLSTVQFYSFASATDLFAVLESRLPMEPCKLVFDFL